MPSVSIEDVRKLLKQIDELKTAIDNHGKDGRDKTEGIKVEEVMNEVPKLKDGTVNTKEWSKLGETEQRAIHQRLVQVRDSLHAATGLDGPKDPKHFMYAAYASNTLIGLWTIIGFSLTIALLYGIVSLWSQATGTDFGSKIQIAATALDELETHKTNATKADAAEAEARRALDNAQDEATRQKAQENFERRSKEAASQRAAVEKSKKQAESMAAEAIRAIRKGGATEDMVLLMVIMLGALGGSLHLVRSLVIFVGNRRLKRSWLLYYLATPVMGAGLASLVYMMLRVGLLGPSGESTGGSAISNLNLIAIYAFAGLTGLFSGTALDKLGELFKTMFRTGEPPSKDALASKDESGPAPASPAA